MKRLVKTAPFAHPAHRAGRLQLFAVGVLSFVVVTIWDPVTQPGPKCCLLRRGSRLPLRKTFVSAGRADRWIAVRASSSEANRRLAARCSLSLVCWF